MLFVGLLVHGIGVVGRWRSERRKRRLTECVFRGSRLRLPSKWHCTSHSSIVDSRGRVGHGALFGQQPAEELVIFLDLEPLLGHILLTSQHLGFLGLLEIL